MAFKPYALLVEGMKEQGVVWFAKFVLHDRDHIALLQPIGKVLAMSVLHAD